MNVVLLCLCFSVVFAIDTRQLNPGSHTPDLSNPTFYEDTHHHVLVIKTSSGCYLYHMTHDEHVNAQNPGGIRKLEDEMIKILSSSSYLVPTHDISHLDHHTHAMCHHLLKFRLHRT